ncbi:MAG: M18 family aminopeptidase [Fibrobacteres bacterium]|nr:M18 family aminopeptidase [Fibrobacterota bacterium]
MLESLADDFLAFLASSPSPWHAARELAARLERCGFQQVSRTDRFSREVAKGFLVEGGAVVAWIAPKDGPGRLALGLAHTDSPCLRVRPHAELISCGCRRLSVETYGGLLNHTWLDRELVVAGRVCVEDPQGIREALVQVDGLRPIVPSLAIHLDRQVNERGLVLDRERHLTPLAGLLEGPAFLTLLGRSVGAAPDQILSWDLCLADAVPPSLAGTGDLVVSPRLDNLSSTFALVRALESASARPDTAIVVAFLDAEEVGSGTAQGADSSFLSQILERLALSWGLDREGFHAWCAKGIALSADMAHAVHPSYPDRHTPHHAPVLGQGPVLKWNAGLRYSTTAATAAVLRSLAQSQAIPLQTFAMRADLGCGSTVGPIVASQLAIPTVDCGAPMLAMHSARETMALVDQLLSERLYRAFLENA